MAYVGSVNNYINLGSAEYLFSIKSALQAAGWTLLECSNGSSYRYNSGNALNPPGPNPTDDALGTVASWNNANAYCRLREPGGAYNPITNPLSGREYVFARGAGVNSMLIKYSRATGFIVQGGISTMPTTGASGDGVVWLSSVPGYGNESSVTATTNAVNWAISPGYVSTVASDTPVNGVYGWWNFRIGLGAAVSAGYVLYTEAVQSLTTPSQDADPSFRQAAGAFDFWSSTPTSPYQVQFWQCYDFTAPINPFRSYRLTGGWGLPTGINMALSSTTFLFPRASTGYGPYTGPPANILTYPMMIGSNTTYPKGMSTGIKGHNVISSMMDTFNLATTEPRIVIFTGTANFSMPWVQNQVPLY